MTAGEARRKPAWGRILAVLLVTAGLAAAWRYTPLSELVTPDRISGGARAIREVKWAPIVVIVAYTPAAFLMFPRPLLTLLTVIAFGPWLGFAYGMTGIIAAAVATYYAGRALPRKTVEHLAGTRLEKISRGLRRHGLMAVLALRIIPAAPFAIEGMMAGALRVKLWHYVVGTFVGMLPGVLTTTVFGDQIAIALEDASKINYWLVGGVVAAFIVLTWLVRRWFEEKKDD